MLAIIIEFILEGLAQLGLELFLWSLGMRWILFSFFAIATVLFYLTRLYLPCEISAALSVALAAWPNRRDHSV